MGFESQYDEPLEYGSTRILSAFQDRATVVDTVDFIEAYLNGTWAIALDTWDGCTNAPTECDPHGMLTVTGNDLYQVLQYTDKNSKVAYLTALDGELISWLYPLSESTVQGDGKVKVATLLDKGLTIENEAEVYTADTIDEFFDQALLPTYEYPTQDDETNDDVIPGLKFNGNGVLITDEAPTYRKVRRNWRRHSVAIPSGTDLDSLFISDPTNQGNYLYLNGVDWRKAEAIEDMTNIPAELEGQVYVVNETADKYGKQTIIKPSTGELWYRSKLENGTFTEWIKMGMPTNIPQSSVIDLVADLLDLANRLFTVEETNFLQEQNINNNTTQINYLAQINNAQDLNITALFSSLNALSLAQNLLASKAQFDGGELGSSLVKLSGNNQDFAFKRTHGARLTSYAIPQAKVGEAFGFNIPASAIVVPEFVWSPLQIEFIGFADDWVQYNWTLNGGITLWGTPAEEGKSTVYAILNCNGYVSTYPMLIQAVDDISAASSLSVVINDYYPPEIALSWGYNGTTPDGFYIYRRANGGAWVQINSVGGSTYTFTDSTANYDTLYDYQVKPYTGGTIGDGSNIVTVQTRPALTSGGLYGRYYDNINLSGSADGYSRIDSQIAFNWSGVEPISGRGTQNYSVRWTGYLKFPYGGLIKFRTRSDDGIRVWVDGISVVDEWREYSVYVGIWQWTTTLVANEEKPITIEYFQGGGDAAVYLEYETLSGVWEIVPSGYLVPEITEGETLDAPVITSVAGIDTDTLNIDWTYSGDVDSFTIQRSLVPSGGIWSFVGYSASPSDRTIDVNSLSEGTTYYFRLQTNFQGRSSGWSNVMGGATTSGSVTPPAPVPLQRAIGWMSPNFTWDNFEGNNGIISRAKAAGVAFATIFIEWWECEQGNNSFNFDELKYRIEKQRDKGLGFVLVIPHRYAFIPQDNNASWQMISSSVQHRWTGSAWTTTNISAKDCAYMSYTEAEMCRDGGYMLDGIYGATGSASSSTFMNAQKRWIARVMDFVYNNYADICYGVMYADGGSTETGFATKDRSTKFAGGQRTETYAFQDGDWSENQKTRFTTWLQTKYVGVANLNAAWNTTYPFFGAIQAAHYMPPQYDTSGDMGVVAYNQNNRTWDWFLFKVSEKKAKYSQIIGAIRNPSSVVGGLINPSTPMPTIAYLTESLTTAQGYTWAAAAVEMLQGFDQVWSSTGSNGGAVGTDSHFKSFGFRASVLRGTIPSKVFAQEIDTDKYLYSDGGRVGPSKTMAAIFAQGATYFICTFFRTTAEWDEANYLSEDGQTRSFKDDMALGYVNHVLGKSRTLPTVSQTKIYNYSHIKANVGNPNNVVSDWVALTNPTAAGLSNTYVDVLMEIGNS